MYYNRRELIDRKWELADIQAFSHDAIKKSETGRGRPSYLYLVTRVEQKEKGLTVDASTFDSAPKVPSSPPIAIVQPAKVSAPIAVCTAPQTIREPASTFAPYVQVNGTVEIAKMVPIRARENPNAVKLDLRKLPKGPKVIIVDSEGNETLYKEAA